MTARAAILALGALAALAAPLAGGHAGLVGTSHRQLFMVRIFTAEVPSAVVEEGRYVRIGVILPPKSKVVKVEAFMDDEDFGRSNGKWRACDLGSGACEVGDVRVEGLGRINSEQDVQIHADFWNFHESRPRFGKLRVTFMPIGNPRRTYIPRECWLRTECGYAGWMDAAYEEEAPVVGEPDGAPGAAP